MNTMIEAKVAEIRSNITDSELEGMTRPFDLADAIMEGSSVSSQSYTWGNGENACALSAAVMSAKARGYLD